MKIHEIVEVAWFKIDYTQAIGYECDWKYLLDDVSTAFDATEVCIEIQRKREMQKFLTSITKPNFGFFNRRMMPVG